MAEQHLYTPDFRFLRVRGLCSCGWRGHWHPLFSLLRDIQCLLDHIEHREQAAHEERLAR